MSFFKTNYFILAYFSKIFYNTIQYTYLVNRNKCLVINVVTAKTVPTVSTASNVPYFIINQNFHSSLILDK